MFEAIRTKGEVAHILGIRPDEVERIERRAILKLREILGPRLGLEVTKRTHRNKP